MTPLQYYESYRNLFVDLIGWKQLRGVDIHEYRNARDYFNAPEAEDTIDEDHDVDDGMDAWAALSRKIRRHGRKVRKGVYWLWLPVATEEDPSPNPQFLHEITMAELASVYFGKGSPEQIRLALRLAAGFGLVDPDVPSMNRYCTQYIGLDCSGFLGNYLRHEGNTAIGPSTPARQFVAPPRSADRLSTMEELDDRCVLCWKNTNHCAIIHEVLISRTDPVSGKMEVECSVCECTGAQLTPGDVHTDGMNFTHYIFKSVDENKVFKVKRGLGGSRLSEVFVSSLLP